MRLKDKVAIITGGTSGIGFATARLFAAEGAKVIISGRNEAKGEKAQKTIRDEGGEVKFISGDVSNEKDIDRIVEETIAAYGKIDVLFNNAGMEGGGVLEDYDMAGFDKTMSLNLRGVMYFCKKAMPYLRETKGSIINTSSGAGIKAIPNCYAYCASKSGLIALTKVIALDYAQYGVRANAICPGMVRTELLYTQTEEFLKKIEENIPIKRMAEPDEISKVVLFLASSDASYLTGQAIVIDGGYTL